MKEMDGVVETLPARKTPGLESITGKFPQTFQGGRKASSAQMLWCSLSGRQGSPTPSPRGVGGAGCAGDSLTCRCSAERWAPPFPAPPQRDPVPGGCFPLPLVQIPAGARGNERNACSPEIRSRPASPPERRLCTLSVATISADSGRRSEAPFRTYCFPPSSIFNWPKGTCYGPGARGERGRGGVCQAEGCGGPAGELHVGRCPPAWATANGGAWSPLPASVSSSVNGGIPPGASIQ